MNFGRDLDCLAGPERPSLPLISVRPDGLDSVLESLPAATAAFLRASQFGGQAGQVALLPGAGRPGRSGGRAG